MHSGISNAALAIVVGAIIAGCSSGTEAPTTTSSAPWRPITATVPTTTMNSSAIDRMAEVYIDTDDADRAYWRRAVQLLSEQDTATLTDVGDVGIAIVHKGERVTLFRDDLGWLAQNVCVAKVKGEDAAKTVGMVKDVYDLPRRWEAVQLRTAALETKCPAA